jgi:septum formation protein
LSPIVLASTSAARARLLANAGIAFEAQAPMVDEASLKLANQALAGPDLARLLAEAKAHAVAASAPGRIVIGADQVLMCDGKLFDKPRDLTEARRHLAELAGKTHTLETVAVACRDCEVQWSHHITCRMTMRPLSERFLDGYLALVGDDALTSVGAYKLEGIGSQLFDEIAGDYFSILGLPLLELMRFLRGQGVLPS